MPPKLIERICAACGGNFIGRFKTCSKECVSKIISEGKQGEKNPNWVPKGKNCCICSKFFIKKERRIATCSSECAKKLQSKNNGMKNPEVAYRVAKLNKKNGIRYFMKTLKGRKIISEIARHRALTNNPMKDPVIAHKGSAQKSETQRRQYANGRKVITFHYQDYKKKNGSTVKLQSSYEVAFAKWLDSRKLRWHCHHESRCPKVLYFQDQKLHTYFPDFFIPKLNVLVDTKSFYFLEKEKEKKKLAAVSKFVKHNLLIITEKEMEQIGINTIKARNVKNQKNCLQQLRKSCSRIKFGSNAVRKLLC